MVCQEGEGEGGSDEGEERSMSPLHPAPITYTDSQKLVEIEAEGKLHKFSIYDALVLMSKEQYEDSLPPEPKALAAPEVEEESGGTTPGSKTPLSGLKAGKKRRKAPHYGTPKHPTLKSLERALERAEREERQGAGVGQERIELSRADTQPVDKKVLKLPEAVFREIPDYVPPAAPPMPDTYFKFQEKSLEQLDKEVEYDMDEEDVAWLGIMNNRRQADQLAKITEDQFELLMDRLEKESYFHVQSSGNQASQYAAPVDDDAICCVCMDGEATNTNVILFCDLCNLAVHQECYGVPYIPEGQWLCRRCLQSPSRSVECCLCPNRGGAFKQTDDGRWAHVVCGLWIPEVRFANTVFLEPIDSIGHIPPARWKLTCRVCKQRGVGACIQCHKNSCYIAFHVTCGLLAGLHMKMETVREAGPGGTSITVRKTAYCDQHTPADSDAKPRLDDVASLGIATPKSKSRSPKKAVIEQHPLPILFRGLMNFSPQCPWDKVQKIAGMVDIQKKNQFIQRLMAYWTLKRQTRNGVPLIRRLQFAKASKSDSNKLETPQKNAHHALRSPTGHFSDTDTQSVKEEDGQKSEPGSLSEFKVMSLERRRMRRLRHDLERVRLLCELIRKREQRKREVVSTNSEIKCLELNPSLYFLRKVMELLVEQDAQDIFAEPVDTNVVTDYLDIVKKPMDFSTMRRKMENHEYGNIDEFEKDFDLMITNCLSYNEKETIFYRAGTKMRDAGGSIIRQAKRQADMIGFDKETGLMDEKVGNKKEEVSDDKLMKEIDGFLNDESRDTLDDDEHVKRLLLCSDKANLIHHPSAKNKRQQRIKTELQKLRRKVSIEKGTKKDRADDCDNNDDRKSSKLKIKQENKKRKRDHSEDEHFKEESKKKKLSDCDSEEKSKKKTDKSPLQKTGVNRRNAVLFTRKKEAQKSEGDKLNIKKEEGEEDIQESTGRRHGSESRCTKADDSSSQQDDEFEFHEPEAQSKSKSRKKGRKGYGPRDTASPEGVTGGPRIIDESLFKTYRQGGGGTLDTDTDTGADSSQEGILSTDSEEESDSSDSEGTSQYSGMSALDLPLEPLDLVWAKCRGYPWYPALIINPKMPRTGYFHNGVPIPVPPAEVLALADSHTRPHYLILFFDTRRTWQWLPRDKLEPLGVDTGLDRGKLVASKKAGERKAVKKAYEEAILHRCRVTGETVDLAQACCQQQQEVEQEQEAQEHHQEQQDKEKQLDSKKDKDGSKDYEEKTREEKVVTEKNEENLAKRVEKQSGISEPNESDVSDMNKDKKEDKKK